MSAINQSPEFLALVNIIYPIGHIYKSTRDVNPGTFIPGTTWTKDGMEGKFLYNSAELISDPKTGGETTAELTSIPIHTHKGTLYNRVHYGSNNAYDFYKASASSSGTSTIPSVATGSYGASGTPRHNNMPPYRVIFMWRRTA